ncbi:MAG: tRNA uridine(34) 5-carboxymethylaminomethyl modification radical SAM/GNAT enzyme Elp3 [Candidatus Nanoarchaeia archaeon]
MTQSQEQLNSFYTELIDEITQINAPTSTQLNSLKTKLAKKHNINSVVKNPQILGYAKTNQEREKLIKAFNTKPIREASGVTVVALFAKPHSCPHGKCMYCPGGPDSPFGDTPQSYTGHEPAAMRAKRNMYDPYLQIFNRLEHYIANGHDPDKLELIFMGGTFPSLDKEYRDEFVKYVYKAINDFGELFYETSEEGKRIIRYDVFNDFFEMTHHFSSQERMHSVQEKILKQKLSNDTFSMDDEITKNETATIRSIGLTIETKPDWALQSHCEDMLRYGCTRLEVGVQTLDEKCLKRTNRGHTLQETKNCFQIAKDMCIKINAHMMLGLPASTLEIDEEGLTGLFEQEDYRPDMLKIYPCLVVEGTPLYNMYKMGRFEPITTEKAAQIIARSYAKFPRYVRVMRVQRDIPTTLVEGGVQKSNLRQYVDLEMKREGVQSKDIRAREIGLKQLQKQEAQFFEMTLQDEPFNSIQNREKTIEFRLFDEKRRKLHIGDVITFKKQHNKEELITVKITKMHIKHSFDELFEHLELEKSSNKAIKYHESAQQMQSYYSSEDEKQYGVVGIEFELLNKNELKEYERVQEEFDIKEEEYNSSKGVDVFLDVVNSSDTLIGFTRLRFPHQAGLMPQIDEKTALIRELHVYGHTIPVGAESGASQHKGWGRKLISRAEEIAKQRGYEKMVIISGVGVREYYKKLGYHREGPYMVKSLH